MFEIFKKYAPQFARAVQPEHTFKDVLTVLEISSIEEELASALFHILELESGCGGLEVPLDLGQKQTLNRSPFGVAIRSRTRRKVVPGRGTK